MVKELDDKIKRMQHLPISKYAKGLIDESDVEMGNALKTAIKEL